MFDPFFDFIDDYMSRSQDRPLGRAFCERFGLVDTAMRHPDGPESAIFHAETNDDAMIEIYSWLLQKEDFTNRESATAR